MVQQTDSLSDDVHIAHRDVRSGQPYGERKDVHSPARYVHSYVGDVHSAQVRTDGVDRQKSDGLKKVIQSIFPR